MATYGKGTRSASATVQENKTLERVAVLLIFTTGEQLWIRSRYSNYPNIAEEDIVDTVKLCNLENLVKQVNKIISYNP